jgi:hypothetical protein
VTVVQLLAVDKEHHIIYFRIPAELDHPRKLFFFVKPRLRSKPQDVFVRHGT